MKKTQSQEKKSQLSRSIFRKTIFVLSLILSGCGQKKTIGYQGPGPQTPAAAGGTPAPTPTPAPEAPQETGTGGIATGPQPTQAPGPKKDSGPHKGPKKTKAQKSNQTVSAPAPSPAVGVTNGPVLPGAQGSAEVSAPAPAPQKMALGPWYAPQIADSPAESWMENDVLPLLKRVEQAAPAPAILSRKIRITLALGYFDGYHAKEDLRYDDHSYGPNTPVDSWLRAITENLLERQCLGKEQICGFERVSDSGVAAVFRRAGNDDIIQEVTVISASLTTNHDRNTHVENDLQQARSEAAEAEFLQSVKSADFVLYVGHSRMGGGPDFFPPQLTSAGEVDYDLYNQQKHGIKALTKALKDSKNRGNTVAILSCDSTKLFLTRMQKAAPNRNFMTMNGIVESQDLLTVGLASIDLFLRRAQITGISQVLSSNPQLSRQATLSLAQSLE